MRNASYVLGIILLGTFKATLKLEIKETRETYIQKFLSAS